MDILSIAIILFCIMEFSNVLILYFKPTSKLGNGVGVFNAIKDVKKDESLDLFTHYMIYWVAGVKLIFILLLLVILITGTELTRLYAVIAMIISILTYFWKLHPIIKRLDNMSKITPKGYSKTLGLMISAFLVIFSIALVIYLF
jgi:glucan phosphoethanolaminetransferase (alkaline phosphatase superfamily)